MASPTPEPSGPSAQPPAPVWTLDFGSIRSMVEYRFSLLDSYVDVNGLPTFLVAANPVKKQFGELLGDLANHGMTARIRRVDEKLAISVYPKPILGKPRTIVNVGLFLATVVTVGYASYTLIFDVPQVLIDALFRGANLGAQVAVLALSILGIVGLHEMGHVVAVRHHRMDATWPYFVPAPPPFPFGTFGAMISLRGPPANRDQLFDLGFSGPIAGFVATIVVAMFAFLTAPLLTEQQVSTLIAQGLLSSRPWPYTPLLFDVLGYLNLRTAPAGYELVLTQVAFAAEVGLLITFLNVLPVWQLDGGHISRAALGVEGHRLAAFVGFGVLILAGYWGFALLLLFFMFLSGRPMQGVEPLDDVSPLSRGRKVLFLLTLVIFALSFVIF